MNNLLKFENNLNHFWTERSYVFISLIITTTSEKMECVSRGNLINYERSGGLSMSTLEVLVFFIISDLTPWTMVSTTLFFAERLEFVLFESILKFRDRNEAPLLRLNVLSEVWIGTTLPCFKLVSDSKRKWNLDVKLICNLLRWINEALEFINSRSFKNWLDWLNLIEKTNCRCVLTDINLY